jgi:hypothetical protein
MMVTINDGDNGNTKIGHEEGALLRTDDIARHISSVARSNRVDILQEARRIFSSSRFVPGTDAFSSTWATSLTH